jgi:hypothetical protein
MTWIKSESEQKTNALLWREVAVKMTGHFRYYDVLFYESQLGHFYWVCVGTWFSWLSRRSQRRSYTGERFNRRQWFILLAQPPRGSELIDISSANAATRNHKPKSRMPESGAIRSDG